MIFFNDYFVHLGCLQSLSQAFDSIAYWPATPAHFNRVTRGLE